jgi:hypothetical protein
MIPGGKRDLPEHPIIGIERPPDSFVRTFWHRIRKPENANAVTAVSTAIYALLTSLLVLVSLFQGIEILASKADTQRLLTALEKQAAALTRAAEEAKTQANAAKEQATALVHQAEATQRQAVASERNAKIADAALSTTREFFKSEQRAWISLQQVTLPQLADGKTITATIINTGKTPATDVEFVAKYTFLPSVLGASPDYTIRTPISTTVLAPGGVASLSLPIEGLTESLLQLITGGTIRLYTYGRVRYRDVFNDTPEHTTLFCTFYNLTSKTLSNCDPKDGISTER